MRTAIVTRNTRTASILIEEFNLDCKVFDPAYPEVMRGYVFDKVIIDEIEPDRAEEIHAMCAVMQRKH